MSHPFLGASFGTNRARTLRWTAAVLTHFAGPVPRVPHCCPISTEAPRASSRVHMFLEARRGAVLPRRVPSRTRSVVERGSERRLVEHDNLMKSHTLNRSLTCIMTLAVVLLSLPYRLLDSRSPSEAGTRRTRRAPGNTISSGRPTAPKIRIGVELSSSSCPRLELSSLSTSSMARSTSVGALLVRAVGVRLPISDPASHAAIRRRELLEETRTLFASATVCSRGGKGLRGGCPPTSALLEMPSSASRYSVLLL